MSVISVARAERGEAHAVVASVPADCSPVRVVVSADGSTVWVTARESDLLLAFSAARLIEDPAHALLAAVRVGEAPVGLALVDGGRWIVVAGSNRFTRRGRRPRPSMCAPAPPFGPAPASAALLGLAGGHLAGVGPGRRHA